MSYNIVKKYITKKSPEPIKLIEIYHGTHNRHHIQKRMIKKDAIKIKLT